MASGKRQAQSGERKPGAVCCQRVAVAWVGRSVGGRFGDACFDVGGVSLFGAYVRQGLPCRESFPDCPTMRTHAREQQEAADLATMYILSQGIAPRPGWFSSLFERFKAQEACISSPPVLFPCLFSFPLKINSRSLKHITSKLCSQPQISALRDFKGIIRNQRGAAQNTICRISNENMLNTTPICGMI